MMEPTLRAAVEAVHASPLRAVLNVTGGGAQSMGWVMAVPGASKTLIEAYVPYARESMIDCLGAEPAQYVSASTARDMAVAAYRRGARLRGGDRHLVGIGCTCALASSPPKKGPHRCHVATFGALGFAEYTLTMEKGRRDRWEEDGLASMLVVQALADAAAESEATGDVDDINIGNIKNSQQSGDDTHRRSGKTRGVARGRHGANESTARRPARVPRERRMRRRRVHARRVHSRRRRASVEQLRRPTRIIQPATRWAPRDVTRGAGVATEWRRRPCTSSR